MKPPPFGLVRPTSVAEAVAALVAHGGDAKILAGGQSLVPMLNFRLVSPKVLIDINGIAELDYLEESPDGTLRIGALTRHYGLMTAIAVRERFPLVAEAMRHVAHVAIRNRGTIGGSISHADPTAELPMVAVLLDATLRIVGPSGSRDVAAAGFFTGALSTVMREDELLGEIRLPPQAAPGWGFREFAPRAGDFALAAVGVVLAARDGRARDVRLAVTGVGETPIHIPAAEEVLEGCAVDAQTLAEASAAARASVRPPDDLHGSADYRRHLVGGLVRQAIEDAWGRAQHLSEH